MPLTPADAYQITGAHFEDWLKKVDDAIEIVVFSLERDKRKDAAFTLHQATARA